MNDKWMIRFFLGLELVLYGIFLTGDLMQKNTDLIKFAAILMCAAAALLMTAAGRADRKSVSAALMLTAAADGFLLFVKPYLVGVLLFCAVQTLYAVRLGGWRLRCVLYAAVLAALWIMQGLTALSAASAWSFVQLSMSAVIAWRSDENRLFASGLSLFWACDVCVGLRYLMESGFAGTAGLPLRAVIYGIWFFYLPAQVCIVLSNYAPPVRQQTGGTDETK